MVKLTPVTKDSLRRNYSYFEGGMQDIINKVKAKFIPADIYHQVLSGELNLFWVEDASDGERFGFTVLSQYASGYEKCPTLVVDHLWLRPGVDVFLEFGAAVHDIAQETEMERLEFNSSRLGWGRRLKEFGFEPITVMYQRQVTNG